MASSVPSDPHVVLVGMMGTGKTTVGEALARRLSWPFFDSDRQVEEQTGRTVAEIWRTAGEPAFRAVESAVLSDALALPDPAVVAAAGGVVLDPDNRRRLRRQRLVVWLRAQPATLARRVAAASGHSHRPLLASDPVGVLARLAAERAPLYEEVAGMVVDVDGLEPAQVVDRIARSVA